MVKKKRTTQVVKPESLFSRAVNLVLVGLGVVGVLLGLLVLLFVAFEAYNWYARQPTKREAQYIERFNELLAKKEPFLLREATPWPWDKACLGDFGLGVDVDMETYATRTLFDPDDPRVALVFFVGEERPWGIRLPTEYFPDVGIWECVKNDYIVHN